MFQTARALLLLTRMKCLREYSRQAAAGRDYCGPGFERAETTLMHVLS